MLVFPTLILYSKVSTGTVHYNLHRRHSFSLLHISVEFIVLSQVIPFCFPFKLVRPFQLRHFVFCGFLSGGIIRVRVFRLEHLKSKMQQPPQMIPMMPSFPSASITTEQIQKYLDENKKLILAILDNQNLGKLAECAQYQAQLQKNLMYLAAIADAQPQAPAVPPQLQMAPHPAMQQGGYYMQHPQAAAMAQQSGMFSPKMQMQFNSPHAVPDPQQLHQQHQQAMQGQMGMRPMGRNNGMHPMHHGESAMAAGFSAGPTATGHSDSRGGSKQDASETGTEGQGGSAARHGSGDGAEGK